MCREAVLFEKYRVAMFVNQILYGSPMCSTVSGVFGCPVAVRMGKMSRIEKFFYIYLVFLGDFS
jgi:hypothetical protein